MQNFAPQERPIGGGEVEIFIQCHACKEETVIETVSEREARLRRRRRNRPLLGRI